MLTIGYEEIRTMSKLGIKPFNLSTKELNILGRVVSTEIGLREDIRNKEVALELAEKVEKATGNDQRIDLIKQELNNARKTYATYNMQLDWGRTQPSYVPRDHNGKIAEASEDRLAPIDNELDWVQLEGGGSMLREDFEQQSGNFNIREAMNGEVLSNDIQQED